MFASHNKQIPATSILHLPHTHIEKMAPANQKAYTAGSNPVLKYGNTFPNFRHRLFTLYVTQPLLSGP